MEVIEIWGWIPAVLLAPTPLRLFPLLLSTWLPFLPLKCLKTWDIFIYSVMASLVAQRLKCLPRMRETWVRSLGWEDPLEKEMASHSSTLAWRIPWREEPGRLQSMGSQRVGHDWVTSLLLSLSSSSTSFGLRQMLIWTEAQLWKWKWSLSVMSNSLRPPWTVAYQASLATGFSRQEYWSTVVPTVKMKKETAPRKAVVTINNDTCKGPGMRPGT